jgi:hypothetical protein
MIEINKDWFSEVLRSSYQITHRFKIRPYLTEYRDLERGKQRKAVWASQKEYLKAPFQLLRNSIEVAVRHEVN